MLITKGDDTVFRILYVTLIQLERYWSEQLSGMRGYFHKSELITMNIPEENAHRTSHIFACPFRSFSYILNT